jgi:DNA-binding transcriptional LysR family regulator
LAISGRLQFCAAYIIVSDKAARITVLEPIDIPVATLKRLPQLKHLRLFHLASRERSLRECAIKHGLTQSSLTRAIHALEASLGERLFDKSKRGIVLTDAGRGLLERTQQIFVNLSEARAGIRTLKSNASGRVRLAVPATLSSFLLPPLLSLYAEELKTTQLSILEGSARHISQWLQNGEVDIGIVVGAVPRSKSFLSCCTKRSSI